MNPSDRTPEHVKRLIDNWQSNGERIVFTNGVFDLLHVGHVRYLAEARHLGDRLIIGLNSDDSVRRLKGESRPINIESERAEILLELRSVDAVAVFPEDNPIALLDYLRPNVHVKGGDYTKEALPETPTVEGYGGQVVILPFVPSRSTSILAEKLRGLS